MKNRALRFLMVYLFALSLGCAGPTWTDPETAVSEDPDFSLQGEYRNDAWGLQVVALGHGEFDAYLLQGGLPGEGWERGQSRDRLHGKRTGENVSIPAAGSLPALTFDGAEAVVTWAEGKGATLKKVDRKSPTLGASPPAGAVVLFDGTNADAWENGKTEGDLLVNNNLLSHQKFGDYRIHLEFRTPYKPLDRGQGRGNSGVYHQGRYETQVLDSFGLEGADNECGGIYRVAKSRVNACFPPLRWQTYDVDFTAARFDEAGKKTANARMTVRLNGILVHENQEVPGPTGAAKLKEGPEPGPIYIQHHGNPVFYRNIWVVPGG